MYTIPNTAITFYSSAIKVFNTITNEYLEVYGKRHNEIFQKLRVAGVPRLDIVKGEQGFLISIDGNLPQFYSREDATAIAKYAQLPMRGPQLTSEDLW